MYFYNILIAAKDVRKMRLVESVRDAMDVTLKNDPTASRLFMSKIVQDIITYFLQ